VSNWGAYALGAGIAAIVPEAAKDVAGAISDGVERSLLEAAMKAGAVDGTTGKQSLTVDGLPLDKHFDKKSQLLGLAG
jgi:D-glutamate cyclase